MFFVVTRYTPFLGDLRSHLALQLSATALLSLFGHFVDTLRFFPIAMPNRSLLPLERLL
jgi:hypothetical protein